MLAMVNAVLEGQPIPSEWKVGEVTLLHKALWDAASYRPVTLLSVVYKLCEAVLNERLQADHQDGRGVRAPSPPQ